MTTERPKFDLGTVVMTPGVEVIAKRNAFAMIQLNALFMRHQRGDWGTISEADKVRNDEALGMEERVLSAYDLQGTKIWIITEGDRSVTTALLPEEY